MRITRVLLGGLVSLALICALHVAGCAGSSTTTSSLLAEGGAGGGTSTDVTVGTTSSTGTGVDAREPAVIRLGALLPLTGDLAAQGADSLRGMQMAAREVNAAGGIHSMNGARLTLAVADTQGRPEVGETELERLVAQENVCAVVGGSQSTVVLPVTEAAERLKVPFVVSTAAADSITERGLKFTFRLCPKAEWYARDQVQFVSDLGVLGGGSITKVALLHEDGIFGRETAASQRDYLARAGIEVVDEVSYSAESADLHTELLRLKLGDAQAVLTATYLDDALLIAKSAAVLRLGLPIVDAGGGTADPEFITRSGGEGEGIFTELEYRSGGYAEQVERNFTAAYSSPLTSSALYSYQAVWLMANALERAGSTEPDRLRLALGTTAMVPEDHMVLAQPILTFDGSGQNRKAQLIVVQVQDSRLVPVWPAEYAAGAPRFP